MRWLRFGTHFAAERRRIMDVTSSSSATLLSLQNNTAGAREREDTNRTREAGNLDEIQGRGLVRSLWSMVMWSRSNLAGALVHSRSLSELERLVR